MPSRPRAGLLFAYDWDRIGFARRLLRGRRIRMPFGVVGRATEVTEAPLDLLALGLDFLQSLHCYPLHQHESRFLRFLRRTNNERVL